MSVTGCPPSRPHSRSDLQENEQQQQQKHTHTHTRHLLAPSGCVLVHSHQRQDVPFGRGCAPVVSVRVCVCYSCFVILRTRMCGKGTRRAYFVLCLTPRCTQPLRSKRVNCARATNKRRIGRTHATTTHKHQPITIRQLGSSANA